MSMPSALEIARQATLKPITEIADDIGIPPWLIEPHGQHILRRRNVIARQEVEKQIEVEDLGNLILRG